MTTAPTSDLCAPVQQREQAVRCWCGRTTWHISGLCDRHNPEFSPALLAGDDRHAPARVPVTFSDTTRPVSDGTQHPPAGSPTPHTGPAAGVGAVLAGCPSAAGDAPTLETVPGAPMAPGAPGRVPHAPGAAVGATSHTP